MSNPHPPSFATLVPWLLLALVVTALAVHLAVTPRRVLVTPQVPTARLALATPVVTGVPDAPPTVTATPAAVTIPVGFMPGLAAHTITADTPFTFLGTTVWVNGQDECFIGVPYRDATGQLQVARLWARCADLRPAPPSAGVASEVQP